MPQVNQFVYSQFNRGPTTLLFYLYMIAMVAHDACYQPANQAFQQRGKQETPNVDEDTSCFQQLKFDIAWRIRSFFRKKCSRSSARPLTRHYLVGIIRYVSMFPNVVAAPVGSCNQTAKLIYSKVGRS